MTNRAVYRAMKGSEGPYHLVRVRTTDYLALDTADCGKDTDDLFIIRGPSQVGAGDRCPVCFRGDH